LKGSAEPFKIYEDPGNPAALETVRRNLGELWKLLRAYDTARGGLPRAGWPSLHFRRAN